MHIATNDAESGLSVNILKFVRNDTFAYNDNLDTLYADLFCDCNIPFWSWIKSKSFNSSDVNCLDRHYVELSSLQASDFDNCTLNLCAENVDNLYTYWNTTEESTLSTLVCTGEYLGYVTRYCSSEGNWEEPNYSNCTRKSIQHIKEQGTGGVTSLVSAVTEFTNAFTDVLDDEFSLVVAKENIVIEVGKASLDEIVVPDRLKTSDSWISDSATEIKLKKNICSGLTGFSSTFYRNISNLFPKYLIQNGKLKSFNGSYGVNSIIADFTIHGTSCSDYSLFIKFDHLLGNYSKASCGHWNFSAPKTANGAWSFFGSRVVDAADSYTICEYNHTTNFAILMSPGKTPLSHRYALSLISAIGCGVSILFLVITILIHVVLWRYLKTDRTKALMNLCMALILSYVIFLTGIKQTENKVVCSAIAVALHYMFLTDFALMLAEGILIVRMVVLIFPTSSIVHRLIPACWIVPFGIVGISAGVTKLKGYGNQQFCWLTLDSNLIWAFIGPALLVILINFIIIIITMYKMMSSRGLASKTLKVKSKVGLKSMCVILPLFGVTWVLGAFSLNEDLVMFQYLFAIFNSLQGLFICVFHCCLNEQVRQGYRHYQRRRHANRMDSKPPTESTNYELPKTQHINENFRSEKEEVNNRI
ncbi:brain-specific angiogenesis inhibitor 3 [Mytilus galloprovincialis]|uniref:Brain-specific angiogenesis inhibitor 3 n=1 Tax=Mytilus galloprovincialis TaxID=29158 RepID=A0A8B6CGG3_MYTGA|nr:brain-specific angiogenesis inhibitor 3 [Mytilus galloprovincialis]